MAATIRNRPGIFLVLVCALVSSVAELHAAPGSLRIGPDFTHEELSGEVEYFRDPSALIGPAAAEQVPDAHWRALPNERLAFGASRDTFWLRIKLRKVAPVPTRLVLEVDYAPLDEVSFFSRASNGALEEHHQGMKAENKGPRSVSTPTYAISEPLPFSRTIYVRIRSENSSIFAPITLWEASRYRNHAQNRDIVLGIYYGIFIVLLVYNGFLFLIVREVRYLLYVLFVLPVFTNTMDNFGHYSVFLAPDYIPLYNKYNTLFLTLNFFLVPFANRVLRFERKGPLIRHDIKIVVGVIVAYSVCSVATDIQFVSLVNLSLLAMTVVYLVLSLRQLVLRKKGAGLFSCALALMTVGIVVRVLMINGLLPTFPISAALYGVQAASAGQDLILNLALAIYLRDMKVQNAAVSSQMRALADTRTAELEKQRDGILSNLHDFVGGQIIDLKFAFQSYQRGHTPGGNVAAGARLAEMIEGLILGVRSYVSQVAEVARFSTDFLGSIHIILLRRYADAARQFSFSYGESENLWFTGESCDPLIRETVFAVLQEVSNNDLKYGRGMSEWHFALVASGLTISFRADSTYRDREGPIGYGTESMRRKLAEIGGLSSSACDGTYRLQIQIPSGVLRTAASA